MWRSILPRLFENSKFVNDNSDHVDTDKSHHDEELDISKNILPTDVEKNSNDTNKTAELNTRETSNIVIRKFDVKNMNLNSTTVIVGRRKSGKSWLARDLLYNLSQRGTTHGMVYSATEKCYPFYSHFFSHVFIEEKFDQLRLQTVLSRQMETVLKEGKNMNTTLSLTFEDSVLQKNHYREGSIRALFVNPRYNANVITITNDLWAIPPYCAYNVDYVFIFAHEEEVEQKRLWRRYASTISTFSIFKDILGECTGDFNCVVIDRTSLSKNLMDRIYYYRGKERQFKFGANAG